MGGILLWALIIGLALAGELGDTAAAVAVIAFAILLAIGGFALAIWLAENVRM